jgi:DNA-directed RNA polymerase subunit K/omega
MKIKQIIDIERVFEKSENDYATVLGVAKKARSILDDYPRYAGLLEKYKPTTIALSEYVGGDFSLEEAEDEEQE